MDGDSDSHRWFNPKPKEAIAFTSSLWSVWVSSLRESERDYVLVVLVF